MFLLFLFCILFLASSMNENERSIPNTYDSFFDNSRYLNQSNNQCPIQFHLNLGYCLPTSCRCDQALFLSSIATIIYHLKGNHNEPSNKICTKYCSPHSDHCM